jgi:hypothetical protein
METLEETAARLRRAVASQAYAQARGLVPAYCAALEREFGCHPPSSPEARRIAEEARELYQWLARTVLLDRAHCATELRRLAKLSAYLQPRGQTPHTYELEG